MDESIQDLILAPFRDIVTQGRIARGNAEEVRDEGMRTMAQGLVKEGERALQRLEPLCRKKYEDFGTTFVNALKDDEEISHFIEQLNDLLYDFEEFVEADNFDAEKFLELRGCSRKAAPGISHRITRLKLFPPADEDPGTTSSQTSPLGPTVLARQPSDQASLQHVKSLPDLIATDKKRQMNNSVPWPPGYELQARQSESEIPQVLPTVQEEDTSQPPLSLLDPWSRGSRDIDKSLELIAQQQEHTNYSDSAIGSEANSECTYSPKSGGQANLQQPVVPPKSPKRIITPTMLGSLLEQTASFVKTHHGRESGSPSSTRLNQGSVASSTDTSLRSSVSDHRYRERDDSYFDGMNSLSPKRRASEYSLDSQFQGLIPVQSRSRPQSPHVRPLFYQTNASPFTAHVADHVKPVVPPPPGIIPDGLMLAEEDGIQPVWPSAAAEMQLGGCEIGLHSSFGKYGGFCKGAIEVMQGELGIKHIKKQGLSVGNVEIAKCKACAYELEWTAVERDLNNEATENFKSEGIGFRLRFLSKSHIPSKAVGEQIYGCLLCVQLRRTTHPNDATVFFGQRQLFAHIARHPRPLPDVPGLTVVQSEEVPSPFANNYDLQLWEPPRASNLTHVMRDLMVLPTATTLQTCRPSQTNTITNPVEGMKLLTFAAGARIIGVQFLEKHQGLWCIGWADHEHGLILAETIRLDLPRDDNIANQGSSSMQAVARWRFAAKDNNKEAKGGGWLSFSKGEVLTNIGWSHPHHWCWSGTNSKGKSGLYPRSHIEPGTLMEAAYRPERVSLGTNDRKTGILSRLSIRRRSGGSVGGGSVGGGSGEGGSSSP